MKKILILFLAFNLLIVATIGSLLFLAETYPFRPGDRFYAVQHVAEQWRLRLAADEARQAHFAIDLAERRLADLSRAEQRQRINAAAVAFDRALDEAVWYIQAAPVATQNDLIGRLSRLLDQAELVMATLQPTPDSTLLAVLNRKIAALQAAATPEQMAALTPAPAPLLEAVTVPFLGRDVDHSRYPLTGGHADVECVDCHGDGRYAGTPTECSVCHNLRSGDLYPALYYPNNPYPDHFAGECSNCHTVENWLPYQFDHLGVFECASCHQAESPEGHYPGACVLCHTDVDRWQEIRYDHLAVVECLSCHQAAEPEGHYPGICVLCHADVNDWQVADFEHVGVTQCWTCHVSDSPEHHYISSEDYARLLARLAELAETGETHRPLPDYLVPASCINCHTDTDDWNRFVFDHTGFTDCALCHGQNDAPVDHYDGQCSNCHDTDGWLPVTFDHDGLVDCQSCHGDDAPADHYDGQCGNCHDTTGWGGAVFTHDGLDNCRQCHQPPADHDHGQCSNCHTTDNWNPIAPSVHGEWMDTPTPEAAPELTGDPQDEAAPTPTLIPEEQDAVPALPEEGPSPDSEAVEPAPTATAEPTPIEPEEAVEPTPTATPEPSPSPPEEDQDADDGAVEPTPRPTTVELWQEPTPLLG